MTAAATPATPPLPAPSRIRNAASLAVLATLVAFSIMGAVGLVMAERLDAQAVGASWMLVAAATWLAYGAVLVVAVVALQRYAHRSGWLIVLGVVWGGFAATWLAARAHLAVDTVLNNQGTDPSWTTYISSPPIEETVKSLGIALVILVPILRRSSTLDGAFVGAVVGAGFQAVENLMFTIPALETQVDDRGGALVTMLFLRGVIGVFSHVVYSALVGAAVGWFIGLERRRTLLDAGILAAAFVVATGLHCASNWAAVESLTGVYVLLSLLGLVVLVGVLRAGRRAEDARLTAWASGPGRGRVADDAVERLTGASGPVRRRERRSDLRAVAREEQKA